MSPIDSALGALYMGPSQFDSSITFETNTEWQAFIEEHKINGLGWFLKNGKANLSMVILWTGNVSWTSLWSRFNVLGTEILLNPDKQAPFERFFLLRSIPWLQKLNPLIDKVVGQELSRYSLMKSLKLFEARCTMTFKWFVSMVPS